MNLAGHEASAIGFLLEWTAKATVLLSAAWVASAMFRRRSAAWRHQVWAIAIVALLALFVLGGVLPAWQPVTPKTAGQPRARWIAAITSTSVEAVPQAPAPGLARWHLARTFSYEKIAGLALALWALGSILCLLKLSAGLLRVASLGKRSKTLADDGWTRIARALSHSLGVKRPVQLLECAVPAAMPATWGLLRPRIILPATASEWDENRRRIVLAHEFAHIQRRDWPLQLCAELLRSLLWFHPLARLAASRLRHESERACDDAVLNSGIAASDYAGELLTLAQSLKNDTAEFAVTLAIARRSNLERRFAAMLNPSIDRSSVSKRVTAIAFFLSALLLLPVGALRIFAQAPSASLTGTVYDPSGAILQNALITVTNQKADTTDTARSDAAGAFSFAALPVGDYELQVDAPGFQHYVQPVAIENGRNVSLSANLVVGSIMQKVIVKTELPTGAENPAPSNLRIGGAVTAAHLLKMVRPVYPPSAKAAGIEGNVILHAIIGKDGRLLSLRVASTQVDPALAQAALDAVSQWAYSPTLLDGQPVEVTTSITINFGASPAQPQAAAGTLP